MGGGYAARPAAGRTGRRDGRGANLADLEPPPFADFSDEHVRGGSSNDPFARLFRPPLDIMFERTFEEVLHAHGCLEPPWRTEALTLCGWTLVCATSSQAKGVGERNERYLIVDVLEQKNFQSLSRNRDLWADKDVKDFIKNQFIFMQVSHALGWVTVKLLAFMHTLGRSAAAAVGGRPSWTRRRQPARCSCSSTPPAAFRTRPLSTRGPVWLCAS